MQAAAGPSQEAGWGGAARLQRPERRWGQRESSGVSDSAGQGGGGLLTQAGRLGAAGRAAGRSGGGAARLRMGCEPRPQAAEGAGARVEPELRHPGASEHLRAAPRARGGRESAGARPGVGPGWGRGPEPRPPGPWATWAETLALPRRRLAASCLEAGHGVGADLRECGG